MCWSTSRLHADPAPSVADHTLPGGHVDATHRMRRVADEVEEHLLAAPELWVLLMALGPHTKSNPVTQ